MSDACNWQIKVTCVDFSFLFFYFTKTFALVFVEGMLMYFSTWCVRNSIDFE
jgi:hypothetical protein